MKKGEERMDDRERKPDNRNNKKRNYQLYIILAIVAAVTVALITGLDSLVKELLASALLVGDTLVVGD